jgi:choice-of-anchor A domain-containing protein/pilin isopeptide linkage protein
MALFLVPATAFAANVDLGTFTPPTATSLGSLDHFAVFAENYTQSGSDMEGSIAVKSFVPDSKDMGSSTNVSGRSGNPAINYVVGISDLSKFTYQRAPQVENTWLVVGDDIAISGTGNQRTLTKSDGTTKQIDTSQVIHVKDSTYTIDFAKSFAGLSDYAQAQYSKADSGVGIDRTSSSDSVTISCDDGFDVANLTVSELESRKLIIKASDAGTKAYSLIINVSDAKDADNVVLGASNGMSIDGVEYAQSNAYDSLGGKVLFNFGTSAGTYDFQKYQMGVVLCPNGTATCTSNSHNGSYYANTVKNVNCEIHQNGFKPQGSSSSATATLEATKALSGDPYSGDESFSFTLEAVTSGAPMPSSATASCKAGGTATFGAITYTAAGTYNYTITETTGETPGMEYDSIAHTVTVTVAKDATTGALSVSSVKYDSTGNSLTVTNKYKTNTTAALKVSKLVSGAGYAGDETFGFLLTELDGAPGPAWPTWHHASCKNGGTATFGDITYTKAGTYYYQIAEEAESTPGMTYDTTPKYAKVVVSGTTSLTATITYGSSKDACSNPSLTVTNTYTAFPILIQKYDASSGRTLALSGCHLQVTSATTGDVYADWVSDASKPKQLYLPAGSYVLTELGAPAGYLTTTPIPFTVASDGTVTSTQDNANGGVMTGGIFIADYKPVTPVSPATPVTPATTPQTGDAFNAALPLGIAIGAAVAVSVAIYLRKRDGGEPVGPRHSGRH